MNEPKRELLKVCWEKSEETITEIFERQTELRQRLFDIWLKDILQQFKDDSK